MALFKVACFALLGGQSADGLILREGNASTSTKTNKTQSSVVSFANHESGNANTFRGFYDAHNTGRGVWKWENALDAYQRHFGALAGTPVAVAEVGVQSGGSLLMWQAALGPQIQLYGLDINPECKKFVTPQVNINLGDQADPAMWVGFFANTVQKLDILVDDGGHEAHQMLQTVISPFPHIQPGGFIAIEDIHGAHYLESFFKPTGSFLAQQTGQVESVHIYPFLLMIKKAGQRADLPPSTLQFAGTPTIVTDFAAMWAAIKSTPGGQIVLQNAGWGPFLTADGLGQFFSTFNGLHDSNFVDTPTGCNLTPAALCTNNISPLSDTQKLVTGVHIFNDRMVVEVAYTPPVIHAVRKGTEWIGYGF